MELERDRGLFFGSIHNTLNHICQVNRSILTYLDVTMPERVPLDQMVWPDRERIENHPRDSGRHAVCCRAQWTEAWQAEEIVMRSPRLDDPPTFPRWVMVVQLFNHQTHHRS